MKSLSGIEGRVMEEKKDRRKKELNKLKDLWKNPMKIYYFKR